MAEENKADKGEEKMEFIPIMPVPVPNLGSVGPDADQSKLLFSMNQLLGEISLNLDIIAQMIYSVLSPSRKMMDHMSRLYGELTDEELKDAAENCYHLHSVLLRDLIDKLDEAANSTTAYEINEKMHEIGDIMKDVASMKQLALLFQGERSRRAMKKSKKQAKPEDDGGEEFGFEDLFGGKL